ncbi:MAG: RnfABCDGE type electron transport complex subunit B [Candidatus Bipolaricaulota bacterium]|nr:RnfABCDGE type electron transport complex subunit B [Candidatus Bipolaricaulota bacterium]
MNTALTVVVLSSIGFFSGLMIYVASKVLPKEDESLAEAARIKEFLPGADCGACGHPGCFAYAQAVAHDKQVFAKTPCPVLSQDKEGMKRLEDYLGLKAEAGVGKKAVVHCTGGSHAIADYTGVQTCAAAVQLASGFNECPYSCIGLGDCVRVCPTGAMSIDQEKHVAVVDWETCIGCGLCVAACPQGLTELIPANTPQYLACNYQAKRDIPGRKRCPDGCIHCHICEKVSPEGAVTWDEKKDLPTFHVDQIDIAIEKCPRHVIRKTAAYEKKEETVGASAQETV